MTRYCAKCSRGFPYEAEVCPHCGHSVQEPFYETPRLLTEFEQADQKRPWLRCFARGLDINLYSLASGIILYPIALITSNIWVLLFMFAALYLLTEAAMLTWFGTTPGKRLGKIRIQGANGGPPNFSQSLKRTFLVFLKGEGLWIPVVSLFTGIIAYKRLNGKGITSWDESCGTTVVHGPVAAGHYWLIVILSVVIAFIEKVIY